MRLKAFMAILLLSSAAFAANTTIRVTQVTDTVVLDRDVDYVITSTEPFTSTGVINFVDTEHAALILQNVKPSKVISSWMKYIKVNGVAARNNTSCQVKMYAQGTIILPYSNKIQPLTCYTEPNFEGDSYSNYSLGHSGGYMNTLTVKMLNNNIRSFKLKRGYMVTFAVGTGGWGYSRCFIADKEDLEMATLPDVLNGKISSYRIFKWYDAQKKGLASDGRKEANAALNTSWCYDWGQGNESLLPDQEWVPNHIYEDWPSSSTCGSVTGSCHMKTNNEPGNSADDHPQDVATVLNNWENLMRTGMRLCSESSHDGSMNHLKAFIDSIDARGWRCDIIDLHCYWSSGFDSGNLNWYSDNYGKGRPIWISEWIWGASWNRNGAFGNGVTDEQILQQTKNILNQLNSNPRVERYAYWNSESKAKIYTNGLTELGKYYAEMNTPIAYNKANEYIPKVVYKAPHSLKGTYTKTKSTYTLTWKDPNGDMLDSIVVECKLPGSTKWEKRGNVALKDKNSKEDISYSYADVIETPGVYTYHVVEYYGTKKFTSGETSVTVAAATAIGALQYGELLIANEDNITIDLQPQAKAPYVVMGMVSNKNTANAITNQVMSIDKTSFKFRFYPWQLKTPVTFKYAETVNYLVLPADTVYHLTDQMTLITQKIGNLRDETEVVFPEPFPEGVVPVVMAQQNSSSTTNAPVTVKVYDITNTGFKVKLVRQEGVTTTFNTQNVNYFACTPGQIAIGHGKQLTVGRDSQTPCGGSARQEVVFRDAKGDTLFLKNPSIVAAPQTNNYEKASVFRMHSTTKDDRGTYQVSIRRQVDATSSVTTTNNAKENGDYIGWFIISDDPDGTGNEPALITVEGQENGISSPQVQHSTSADTYTLSGAKLKKRPAQRGVYIVDGKKVVVK